MRVSKGEQECLKVRLDAPGAIVSDIVGAPGQVFSIRLNVTTTMPLWKWKDDSEP